MSKIKSFKGKLTDSATGNQDKIHLGGGKSDIGFKIHKLQVMPAQPFNRTQETVVKLYLKEQSSINGAVDFTDELLLGVAIFKQHDTVNYMAYEQVLFDDKVINQDVYVTAYDAATGEEINYYVEFEEVKMSASEQAAVNFRAIITNKNS